MSDTAKPPAETSTAARSGRPTLRRELMLLAAALAIPLLALQAWWGYHDYEAARERAEADALAFADATALGVLQFFSQAEGLMEATAGQFGPEGVTRAACSRQVATMSALFPFLSNALVVDADGAVVCSSASMDAPVSAVEWPWWDGVQSDPRFTIGDPAEADIVSGWVLPLVAPLTDESGAFAGAVVGTVELIRLSEYFGTLNLPETHLITVATADRIVISRSHSPDDYVGRPLPPLTGSDRPVAPGRWVATGPDLTGIERTWGQIEVSPGWIIYVGVPDEVVYGPALRESIWHVAATLFVMLLGLLLAGHSYRDIAGALRELADRTRGVGRGERVAVPDRTPKEIAEVVDRFNQTMIAREHAQLMERQARDRFRSIFDNAVFGLYVSTKDGRFLEVNPALATMLGYESPEALIDAGISALYPDPEDRKRLIEQCLDTGEVPINELDWLRADGVPITVRVSGKLISGPDDDQVFEMIVQDITEERRTQDELRQTQKMEAIGQLAGGVAHDFNNLLTVIGGNVELLEDDIPAGDPLRHDLSEISRATRRATSLTRRLLTFSRRERRGDPLDDANEVIPGLCRLLVPLIGEDVQLTTTLGDGPFPIALDPGELEQVLLNLVLNARDALPSGGTILVATERSLRMTERDEEGEVPGMLLTVEDDGVGIDPAMAPRIFEPFYTTKPMGRGTGLGLSTVYGIVKRAGGTVDVATAVGSGTTLQVWFPLAGERTRTITASSPTTATGGDETILVVEDDEQVMTVVRRTLTEAGYQVFSCANGADALDLVRTRAPHLDLVLTDVVMPRVGGPELAERLALIAPTVPVLFMSGYVDNTFLSAELEAQPELLLRKPFTTNELRTRVRQMLDAAVVREER